MNLVCQGAGGLGGQDWDGPHREVGRLVLGHTAREDELRVGSTGHHQDIAWRRVSRLIGSNPTLISSNCDSVFEQCRSFHSLKARGWHAPAHRRDESRPDWCHRSTGVSSLGGCVPHSQHHPSQPVMCGLILASRPGGSAYGSSHSHQPVGCVDLSGSQPSVSRSSV